MNVREVRHIIPFFHKVNSVLTDARLLKRGVAYGQSDEWSWKAQAGKAYCYDLHATLLHLLGINHEKLTFRHNGTNRRLTDVHGDLIQEILA